MDVESLIEDLRALSANYEREGEHNTDREMKHYLLGKADGIDRAIEMLGRAHFAETGEVVL